MCQWKFRLSMQCPQCNATQEDKQHILTCPTLIAQKLWEKSLKSLDLWLQDKATDIVLQEHLLNYRRSWPLAPSTMLTSLPFFAVRRLLEHSTFEMVGYVEIGGSTKNRFGNSPGHVNPADNGPQKSSRRCGTWCGTCGSNGTKLSTTPASIAN